jgi:hypothetical protein
VAVWQRGSDSVAVAVVGDSVWWVVAVWQWQWLVGSGSGRVAVAVAVGGGVVTVWQ